jgi:hypothetical protein
MSWQCLGPNKCIRFGTSEFHTLHTIFMIRPQEGFECLLNGINAGMAEWKLLVSGPMVKERQQQACSI